MPTGGTTDLDEEFACAIMKAVLGVDIHRLDGVRSRADGLVDLEFDAVGNRGIGVAEVVSTRDAGATELSELTRRSGYTTDENLTRMWDVRLAPGARVRKVHQDLPSLLTRLETAGIHWVTNYRESDWVEELDELRISTCWSGKSTTKHPPGYYVNLQPVAAWVGDGDLALDACEDFIRRRPDKAKKLGRRLDAAERHIVVLLDATARDSLLNAFFAIGDGETPTRRPVLPQYVDALWLIPLSRREGGSLAYWPPGGPWQGIRLDPAWLSGQQPG